GQLGRSGSDVNRRTDELVIGVIAFLGVGVVLHDRPDLLPVRTGKHEYLVRPGWHVVGVGVAGVVPARPDAIDVAMMHPENRIVGRPRYLSHALVVADEDMDVAVKTEVE